MRRAPIDTRVPFAKDPARFRILLLGLVVLGVAAVEILGHFVVRSRVVPEEDWKAAADFVRNAHRPKDAVVVAPDWADPLLRLHFGELISLRDAAAADGDGYERLWVVSIRGHRSPSEPGRPELDRSFGSVRVRRFSLPRTTVLYDFVDHVADAQVELEQGGARSPCRWARRAGTRPGGLGDGPMWPAQRFDCDPRRPWLWVGETVMTDLDLRPRRCIWQHPAGKEPVRITFRDVPLGERIVVHGGLHYFQERELDRGPVRLVVSVDGEPVGEMVHRDGDGWKRMESVALGRERGEVTIEVMADDPHLRTFCWSGSTRTSAHQGREGQANR